MPFTKTINRRSLRPAFTLIEILIVLTIMAVLTGILLYSTNNAREKGKDARRKADLQAVASLLVAYYVDNHHYPPDSGPPPSSGSGSSTAPTGWIPDLSSYTNGSNLPNDPLSDSTTSGDCTTGGTAYYYCIMVSLDKKRYTLWAKLENSNDPELSSNSNAKCYEGSTDFALGGAYYGLSKPLGSDHNYCIKSPL